MAVNKHWILNDEYQALFKVDFDVDAMQRMIFDETNKKLNGGLMYGLNPDAQGYLGESNYIVKTTREPLTDFKTKINSIVLGTYDGSTKKSCQDNKVTFLNSWESNLCNYFVSDETFAKVRDKVNYGLPYGNGDASAASLGYWAIDFKVKTAEYYMILNHIKDAAYNFHNRCYNLYYNSYRKNFSLYIGHIGGIYEYLNGYDKDFPVKSNYLITQKNGGSNDYCFPILWWNCVSDGYNKLSNVYWSGAGKSTNLKNLYFQPTMCLYYNKNTGMCVVLFYLDNAKIMIGNPTGFDAIKNFLLRCVDLQSRVGYITQN